MGLIRDFPTLFTAAHSPSVVSTIQFFWFKTHPEDAVTIRLLVFLRAAQKLSWCIKLDESLPSGFAEYLHKRCAESLRQTAKELKRGNPDGLDIAKEIFHSARWFWDDEDTTFLFILAISINEDWMKEQSSMHDGKNFLSLMGGIFDKFAMDYENRSKDRLNADMREFVVLMDRRVKDNVFSSSES